MIRLGKNLAGVGLTLAVGLTFLVPCASTPGCDPSGGDRGFFQPDMTWGPASNSLYSTDPNWVEQFCKHVHVTCQDEPQSYNECLMEWRYGQEACPDELSALLSCMDALYSCGDIEDWTWWDLVSAACAPEGYAYEMCVDPYTYWY